MRKRNIQNTQEKQNQKFIRFPAVQGIVGGFSRSTIIRWIQNGTFPKSRKIGPNISAWLEHEVLEWVNTKAVKEKVE